MNPGKEKCRVLRDIRRKIAEENGIEMTFDECHHQGDCRGTCPKCDRELQDLERQLTIRRRSRMPVKVTGLIGGLILLSSASCSNTVRKQFLEDPPLEDEEYMGEVICEPFDTDTSYFDETGWTEAETAEFSDNEE